MTRLLPLLLLVACNDDPAPTAPEAPAAPEAAAPPAAAPAEVEEWACPMHPDITGAEGDKCSECGMPLERSGAGDAKPAEHGAH